MTIGELLRGRSTLDQLDILMRADAISRQCAKYNGLVGLGGVGRYFGGQLTEDQLLWLSPRKAPQQVPAKNRQTEERQPAEPSTRPREPLE